MRVGCGAGRTTGMRADRGSRGGRGNALDRIAATACDQHGSGSVLAVALIGASMLLAALIIPLLAVLAVNQSVQNAADSAALAAADTASGLVAGYPCAAAQTAAMLGGASVTACTVDGLIASVTVARRYLVFDLKSNARAGPPVDAD